MNIMIIGAGEIGRHLALRLADFQHNTVLIDAHEGVVQELGSQIDAKVIHGSGSSSDLLLEAGVTDCEVFFALTSDDNTNLVSCSLAKKLGAQKVICRLHPDLEREAALFDYKEHFGLDHIFSSERLSAIEFVKHIRNPESLFVEDFARGQIELQQLTLPRESAVFGQSLAELDLPTRVRIGAIERENRVLIPTAHDQLLPGDTVTIIGDPRKLPDVTALFGNNLRKHESPRVIISGGGDYGFALAQALVPVTPHVRIFEADPARALDLGNLLPQTTVLNLDVNCLAEQKEERVGECDFFVATTPSDQDNFMTCLQARQQGSPHCLTLMHRSDYADAISSFGSNLGMGHFDAVSPRVITARELLRFITADRYHVIMKLRNAEVIECPIVEGSALAHQKLKDVPCPEGSLVAAILRGAYATVPLAADEILPGDTVYAVVSNRARKAFLQLLKRKK
ncbi:MAG: Trk system potassium transporter TrkA [Verrucomicrobiota bacterium]